MKAKTQKFEAVKFMHAKREGRSRLHSENPAEYKRQLEENCHIPRVQPGVRGVYALHAYVTD